MSFVLRQASTVAVTSTDSRKLMGLGDRLGSTDAWEHRSLGLQLVRAHEPISHSCCTSSFIALWPFEGVSGRFVPES